MFISPLHMKSTSSYHLGFEALSHIHDPSGCRSTNVVMLIPQDGGNMSLAMFVICSEVQEFQKSSGTESLCSSWSLCPSSLCAEWAIYVPCCCYLVPFVCIACVMKLLVLLPCCWDLCTVCLQQVSLMENCMWFHWANSPYDHNTKHKGGAMFSEL
jgi:hypothetical protein